MVTATRVASNAPAAAAIKAAATSGYASTIRNLAVDSSSKCIVQGFTGKSVSYDR